MNRRETLAVLGGTIAVWPAVAPAQPAVVPVIGFLSTTRAGAEPNGIASFYRGLNDHGFVVGRNVAMEFRNAGDDYSQLPALAVDLVRRQVAVIVAIAPPAALAAKSATATIPIVFSVGLDPVVTGLVASLPRPGGNTTGVALLQWALGAKRLELLIDLTPKGSELGFLANPTSPDNDPELREVRAAAQAHGRTLHVVEASSAQQIEAAFKTLEKARISGLLVGADPLFLNARENVVRFAARLNLPSVYLFREFCVAGGLASVGPNLGDARRLVGAYTARILKGEKPGEMPVQQPTTFEVAINLKTAKALGITIPDSILLRADEVIE